MPPGSWQREGVPKAPLISISKWDKLCSCQDLLAGLSPALYETVPILSNHYGEEEGTKEGFLGEEAGNRLREGISSFK